MKTMKKTVFSHEETQQALNNQIALEAEASYFYLSSALWLEQSGYQNIAAFFYNQSQEEHQHMLKIMKYLISIDAKPEVPGIEYVKNDFKSVRALFEQVLVQERKVTKSIHSIYKLSQDIEDLGTIEFLNWFIAEQIEEEDNARRLLELLDIIGDEGRDLWFVDQEVKSMIPS